MLQQTFPAELAKNEFAEHKNREHVDENIELSLDLNRVTHRTMTELRIAKGILTTNARTGTIVFALHIPFVSHSWLMACSVDE